MRCLSYGALVSILACAACDGGELLAPAILFSPCEPVVLEPSGEVLSEELSSIEDAAEMWNAIAGTRIAFDGPPDAQRIPIWFEEAAPFHYGVYRDQLGDVVINRRLADRSQRTVTIAHELGHAFGLFHVDRSERASLMNAGNLTVEATPGDASELATLWGCLSPPVP
jgi:hypothetical protein